MRRFKLFLGLVLLVAGVALIATPFYHEWQQQKELRALDDALAMIEDESDSSESDYEVADRKFTKEELESVYELEIPSIGLNQKVLGETTEENLNMSLAQIKQDQVPGEGNFTIAGHRGYRGDRHFRDLPNVENGEEVHLTADGKTYIYEINKSEVIEATDVDVLDETGDKDEITMITCTIGGQQRISVQGDLVDVISN